MRMSGHDLISHAEHILSDLGIAATRNVALQWVTNRSPLGEDCPAPPQVRDRLRAMHARLGGDWARLKQKRHVPIRFDLQVENTLIEVEQRHHFSSARMLTLDFYDDIDHDLNVVLYRELCSKFSAEADRYHAEREAVDFPFPGGRTAQRAYFDAAKDLLAPTFGFRLIRVPAADDDLIGSMSLTLRALL